MKDLKPGDFVRVAYTRTWPGKLDSDTADIIDWGLIITGFEPNKNYPGQDIFRLVSNLGFTFIIQTSREWLEKILVAHEPKRTFSYVGDQMSTKSDVIWKVKSDRDDVVLLVFNPRYECDEDGYHIVWEKLTKEDGSELTELEEDTYSSDLRDSLRGMFTD